LTAGGKPMEAHRGNQSHKEKKVEPGVERHA
jgi:hypothetical protein